MEPKPIYETEQPIDGKKLAIDIYNKVMDIISGGIDALCAAERAYDAVDNRSQLDGICDELETWSKTHHAFTNALQRLRLYVDLREQDTVDDKETDDG